MLVHVCQESGQKTETATLTVLDRFRCYIKPCDAIHTLYTGCRAVYELTAVVAHVVDAAENSPAGTAPEGHLVAHVKVWPNPHPTLPAPYLAPSQLAETSIMH